MTLEFIFLPLGYQCPWHHLSGPLSSCLWCSLRSRVISTHLFFPQDPACSRQSSGDSLANAGQVSRLLMSQSLNT